MIILINKNSAGGTALKKWERIYKQLNLNESNETSIYSMNGLTDKYILESVRKDKTDFIIAGGDGSINFFLNRCMNLLDETTLKQIRIGALGIGSSNDFHKPFNQRNMFYSIPHKINFRETTERDVGCIHFEKEGKILKKYFLINASLGITAEGNNFFNHPDSILRNLKRISTQTAIIYTVFKNIIAYKNFKINMEINNESFTANISNLGIIKSSFFTGKLRYQSVPLPNNGLFDVHLYESLSKVRLIKLFYFLSKNLPDDSLNKKFWRTNRIKITSDRSFAVEFDGEVINTKNVEFSIIPRCIKVCVN